VSFLNVYVLVEALIWILAPICYLLRLVISPFIRLDVPTTDPETHVIKCFSTGVGYPGRFSVIMPWYDLTSSEIYRILLECVLVCLGNNL
jgi:hypothetical protein